MSQFNVNPGNVKWVVKKLTDSLQGSDKFSFGEVLLGVSEVLGRTIVDMAETPDQGISMVRVSYEHMSNTVVAGFTSKGFNMGDGNGDV